MDENRLYQQRQLTNFVRYHQNQVRSNVRVSETTIVNDPEHLFISDNIYIGPFNYLEASGGLHIGEGVQITSFCNITTHSSHISIRVYGRDYTKHSDPVGYLRDEIHIGDYSFIGSHCVIMPGTKIGKGCMVKAFSILKGEYPDFSIIGGSPAQVIGSTKDIDAKYLESNPELKELYNQWAK